MEIKVTDQEVIQILGLNHINLEYDGRQDQVNIFKQCQQIRLRLPMDLHGALFIHLKVCLHKYFVYLEPLGTSHTCLSHL